ncbi:MAG: hypothetical protein N2663_06855 [Chlorobi bacterium]|nr:hypothetical protein [Chlorobiota bacterium]
MASPLTVRDAERIASVLGGQLVTGDNNWSIEQRNGSGALEQLVTIYPHLQTPDGELTLIAVQSRHGFLQLFGCSDYVIVEPDEVLFVARSNERASCLLVGAGRTSTMYADIPLQILRVRIDTLDPALLLAVMQLSLAEHVLLAEPNGST